jgi:nicotinate phosphoribosyltransferase
MAPLKPNALFADLYELTMAQAYWQSGHTGQATFSLFFRKHGPDRAYFVFAGLQDVLDYLQRFRFSSDDIAFLRSTNKFDPSFLDYLAWLRFTGTVRAMPEGTIFFANEPVIEVTGPVVEAQIVETYIMNAVNIQTILATKASRVVHAARGKTVVDFAARRTQGMDAANALARVSYMVGFDGTSNVLAGARFGIPTVGTMAHSFVSSFESEADSFRAYSRSFPDTSTFLVDTYDTVEGTRKAIQVALEMKRQGHRLRAIRLDSGDLLDLSIRTRRLLDEAGLGDVQVFASGGLDEYEVDSLLRAGAPIDGFGVGTKVGVSADAPYGDSAYKLVEYDGRPVLKLSADKQTLPGPKQVYRFYDEGKGEPSASSGHAPEGCPYLRDVIACASEPEPDGARPLLAVYVQNGKGLAQIPDLERLRERFRREFARLPDHHKALKSPKPYEVTISEELKQLSTRVAKEVKAAEGLG